MLSCKHWLRYDKLLVLTTSLLGLLQQQLLLNLKVHTISVAALVEQWTAGSLLQFQLSVPVSMSARRCCYHTPSRICNLPAQVCALQAAKTAGAEDPSSAAASHEPAPADWQKAALAEDGDETDAEDVDQALAALENIVVINVVASLSTL